MKIEEISKEKAEIEIINSIKNRHKDLRQKSKTATFALTYQGTAQTLVKNQGFPLEEATQIYNAYHSLYKESDDWINKKLESAEKNGYITCAFGLRVRTHKIKQSLMGVKNTPHEAEAERRTAGNALGQSWGLLNNRAAIEFRKRLMDSPYRNNIRIMSMIHDATYFMVKDDVDTILWFNKNITECFAWQNHPDITHPEVKLGGDLSIFFPDWAHELVLPHDLTEPKLEKLVKDYLDALHKSA